MERIREKVKNNIFKIKIGDKKYIFLNITISLGIGIYIEDLYIKEEVMEMTDLTLYYAKFYKRNQVIVIPKFLFT